MKRVTKLQPEVRGLFLMLLSTVCVSIMAVVVKLLAHGPGIPVMEIVLARSLAQLVMSTGMLMRAPAGHPVWPWRSPRRGLLLVRGLVGLAGISTFYWAIQLLPLADVAVIGFLAPVFVAVASPLLLGEHVSRGLVLAMPLCVVGLVLVAQPTFLFGSGVVGLSTLGVWVAIAQAACNAAAKLCIRSLGSTEPVGSIVFSMASMSTLGSAALCALLPHHFVVPPSAPAWAMLLGVGLLGCAVQVLATSALKLARAAPAAAIGYVSVVWSLLADLLVFHHTPNLLSLLGAALVCSSSFVIVLSAQARNSNSPTVSSSPLLPTDKGSSVLLQQQASPETAAAAAGTKAQHLAAALELRQHDGSAGKALNAASGKTEAGMEDACDESAPLIRAAAKPPPS